MGNSVTESQIKVAAEILSRLEPGLLPFELFKQFARLMTTATVVLVPIVKDSSGQAKVHLIKRAESDPYYAGLYHPPGTVIRASDHSIKDSVLRILEKELKNPVLSQNPMFVGYVFDQIVRGKEVSLIHWIELSEKPIVGELFDFDKLPKDIIENDIPRITMAVQHYLEHTR